MTYISPPENESLMILQHELLPLRMGPIIICWSSLAYERPFDIDRFVTFTLCLLIRIAIVTLQWWVKYQICHLSLTTNREDSPFLIMIMIYFLWGLMPISHAPYFLSRTYATKLTFYLYMVTPCRAADLCLSLIIIMDSNASLMIYLHYVISDILYFSQFIIICRLKAYAISPSLSAFQHILTRHSFSSLLYTVFGMIDR